ncbi:MAG: efflux RND transporter periplasmic adaptor subunit [Acidobacteria bacterium]|uniref:Efflux RND transporter periplasmic adaptor subunit n=1 Tax=Candidatus Polarisedimenticola svalbardensis TaxID=2886004 RepID=A0A8J7CE77_9BACT|nr:efflux RND transporter periplasmic adaptor subunit [Candidatus Polarisedimenticola svalbardensis]
MMTTKITNAALLLTALIGVAGCGGGHDAAAVANGPDVTVEAAVSVAEAGPVQSRFEVTGSAEPWRKVAPGTKLMGRIAEVPVREGDRVRKGQLLARLDARDLNAAVEQARAALAMAEASHENARVHHERLVDLHSRGSVTDKNLEDGTAGARVAKAGVEQARANLSAAEVMLDYAVIRSPVAGWITSRSVEAGNMATPGAPMFVVEDLSRIKVTMQVPEGDVVGITAGDPVEVRIDVLDLDLEAVVDRVVPTGDPASRTYQVQVVVDNGSGEIKSGMFVRTKFQGESRDALLVPASAVVNRGQLTGIFAVAENGMARLRWVRTGRLDANAGSIEILSGLSEGERYVPEPPARLVDGARVQER